MSETAIVTDLQRFSLNDGPGIRTTVFLKGCNMNCAWCHNPETIRTRQDLHYHQSKCIGCYKCVYACPSKAHKRINGEHRFFPNLCVKCGKCTAVCYAGAMEMSGEAKTVSNLMREIMQDRSYYQSSGGGVTLSGGEVLCQKEFAKQITKACHDENIKVGMETNLNFPWEEIEETLLTQDLIMCDLKLFDDTWHQKWTGASNAHILENIRKLDASGIPYIVRTPLIPNATDSDENIDAISAFLSTLTSGSRMYYELLNFNPLGDSKYQSLSRKNPFHDTKPLPKARLQALQAIAQLHGVDTRIE